MNQRNNTIFALPFLLVRYFLLFPIFRFALVGGTGLISNICIVYLLRPHMHLVLARTISYIAAFTLTWGLNRLFTFHSDDPKKLQQWLRYATIYSLTGALHISLFAVLTYKVSFFNQNPIWAIILVAAGIAILNFLLSKRFAFKATATPVS